MGGILAFQDRVGTQAACIEALTRLHSPEDFACARGGGGESHRLEARPRVFECAACGRQHSVTAGTIFHHTRARLRNWFLACWWMAHDKPGASALFLARELGLRYEAVWLLAQKLRHALSEADTTPHRCTDGSRSTRAITPRAASWRAGIGAPRTPQKSAGHGGRETLGRRRQEHQRLGLPRWRGPARCASRRDPGPARGLCRRLNANAPSAAAMNGGRQVRDMSDPSRLRAPDMEHSRRRRNVLFLFGLS